MEPLAVVFCIIMGIGALVVLAFGLIVMYYAWWIIIPIFFANFLGFFGFLFGIGLDVVIWFIIAIVQGVKDQETQQGDSEKKPDSSDDQ